MEGLARITQGEDELAKMKLDARKSLKELRLPKEIEELASKYEENFLKQMLEGVLSLEQINIKATAAARIHNLGC
jgi:hypothetical protein